MHKLNNISIKFTTGSNLTPLGIIYCSFKLGNIQFHSKFIVCKHLSQPLIIGRDFLLQHHITVCYDENGKCVLDYQQQELVAPIEIEDIPQISMTHTIVISGRTLAIVCVYNNLDPHQSGTLYEVEPNNALMNKYPNICIIPMIHNVDVPRIEHLPLIVINFATDDISLLKGEIMGFMQIQNLELSEIITETSAEPSFFFFVRMT